MKKGLFAVISLFLAVALFVSGCSSGGGSAKQKSNVTLTYNSMWNQNEPQGEVIASAVKDFKTKTGITVNVNYQGRDTRKTLQPALDSGKAIDLFDEDLDRVNTTWAKYLLNVESYANQKYDTTDGKAFTDVVNKKLISLARSLGPDGKLSTIPYQPSTFVVMCNKDIFKKAGITSYPQTWEQWLDACAKIKAIGKTPITVDDAYMPSLFGYHMARLIGRDKTLAMADNNDFSNPAVLTFGQQWQEMYEKGYISPKAASSIYPAAQQEIALGQTAMYLNGTWLPNEIKNAAPANFNWGSFAYPAVGTSGDSITCNQYGAQCFAINKNSKHPKEAFEFIVYMTTGKYDTELANKSIGVPMSNNAVWPKQLTEAKKVFESDTERYTWAVGMENNDNVSAKIKKNFALLVSGKFNAQQFADAMKK